MIREFTDLTTWQKGHELVLVVYEMTARFPKTETYALVDQLKRAVVSVTSNIAEGFGRRTIKEKIQFFYQAHGSLTEVKNQLIVAKDVKYVAEEDFVKIMDKLVVVQKLLLGLIAKTRSFGEI